MGFLRWESAAIQDLRESIVKLKFSGIVDILVEGETGSGKEVCARLLHTEGPFVAVNCAAVPADLFEAEFFGSEKGAFTGSTQARPGYLENAGNGTLFLDEIQSLPIEQQAKLLRVLESRKFRRVGGAAEKDFRARVISASNLRLTERVARGLFREDLYYRLSTLRLCVPPLRARREDITSLLTRMVTDSSQGRLSLESEALLWASDSYEWPGNFRELKSLATRLSLTHPIPRVDLESLRGVLEPIVNEVAAPFSGAVAFAIDWSAGLDANVERLEKCMVMKALGLAKTSEARDFLKIGRTRFYEKLREFGLSREP